MQRIADEGAEKAVEDEEEGGEEVRVVDGSALEMFGEPFF